MQGYLGETIVNKKDTVFKDFTQSDWAMYFIERYGQIDGDHHKAWVLDQVARILKGSNIIIKLAKWGNGYEEYRIRLDEPSEQYIKWVEDIKGEYKYDYEPGIAP